MKLLLCHLVLEEKLFALDLLNARIKAFDYGYNVMKDKPSTINSSKLSKRDGQSLGQSGITEHVFESSYNEFVMCVL